MPFVRHLSTRRKVRLFFGLFLAGLFYAHYELSSGNETISVLANPVVMNNLPAKAHSFEELIRSQPLKALIEARAFHVADVDDYTCKFIKQELLPSGVSAEQEIDIKFRQEPYSVVFHWVRNPGRAERVIYVKGRWVDKNEDDADLREEALCQPGPVLRALIKSIRQPIHGSMANDASRRCIDEFGFKRSLDLLIQYCELAEKRGELKLAYRGESDFDGRPTWVLRRTLPYTGDDGLYPDRVAEIHIDQKFKVPVAVYTYSHDDMRPESLLGKYEYRAIKFDIGLTETDFAPATYGM